MQERSARLVLQGGMALDVGMTLKAGLGLEAGVALEVGMALEAGVALEVGMALESGMALEAGLVLEAGMAVAGGIRFGQMVAASLPRDTRRRPLEPSFDLLIPTRQHKIREHKIRIPSHPSLDPRIDKRDGSSQHALLPLLLTRLIFWSLIVSFAI